MAIKFRETTEQDPEYGIDHSCIAPRLHKRNWKKKAAVRISDNRWLYIWITRASTRDATGKSRTTYEVGVHTGGAAGQDYEAEFDRLEDAIAYANGEDHGSLSQGSVPATPEQWPAEREPAWTVTTLCHLPGR